MKKKTLLVMMSAMTLILGACSGEKLMMSEQEKDYYLIATDEKYKNIEEIPEKKCLITKRGKHSFDGLKESEKESEQKAIKDEIKKGDKLVGCMDSFDKEEIKELEKSEKIKFIRFLGNKDPFNPVK